MVGRVRVSSNPCDRLKTLGLQELRMISDMWNGDSTFFLQCLSIIAPVFAGAFFLTIHMLLM